MMNTKKLIERLIYLILFICVANFLANKFYWYSGIWYFDMIMHFLGGFWVGLSFFYVFRLHNISLHTVLKVLLFVLLVGVGWEVFEVLVNDVIAKNPFNYLDTFSDVFFDLSGGASAMLYFFERIMLRKQNTIQ